MAQLAQQDTAAAAGERSEPWIPTRYMIVVCGILAMIYVAARVYQQVFAWSTGLDSTSPEFQKYWMNLLHGEFALEAIAAATIWGSIWITRPKSLENLPAREELRRLGKLVAMIFTYVFAVFFAGSFFAEQDATWHQTVVRDTSFTPSHIILFYGSFPVYIILGVAAYLYSYTRLPRFAARHSLPWIIAVAGPFMLLPVVAYNEWSHTFWSLEERFGGPVHWGFVFFAWSGFGIGGLLLQILDHLYELTTGQAQTYSAPGAPKTDPALEFEREVA